MTRERLLTIALLIGAGMLAGAVYFQRREIKRLGSALGQKDAEIRRLGDGTVVVREVRGTPETVLVAAERAGFDVGALRADLDDHGATLRAVLSASTTVGGVTTSPQGGSPVLGAPSASQLMIREQVGDRSIAWGRATFDAASERPWTVEQFARTYAMRVALGERDDGTLQAYVGLTIAAQGEQLQLEPTAAQLTVSDPAPRWRWGAMPLLTADVGVREGAVEWVPGAAVALAGYGAHRDRPTWTLLAVGAAYEVAARRVALGILPASFTLRDVLPVISTSVGPAAYVDADGAWTFALGMRVNL